MLTTWKQTRTTVEYPRPSGNRHNEDSTKQKKKSKKSQAAEEDDITQDDYKVVMGAQFIPPLLSRHSSFHRERVTASSSSLRKSSKKRRKINHDPTMDKEPILCITSPHRVVFMEDKGEKSSSNNNTLLDHVSLVESKSRTYVARPGTSSRFFLRGNIGQYAFTSSGTDDDGAAAAFAGMIPPGAQYDPASNLMYAIRNGGAEVAIWSAVPSSILPGPDDDVLDVDGAGSRINGSGGRRNTVDTTEALEYSVEAAIACRLKLPEGKNAVILTPFSIQSSSLGGKETLGAVGAGGCCEDGTIWLAIRHQSGGMCSKFQILLVDGSSNEVVEASSASRSGVKVAKRRKTSNAVKMGGWRLLDSSAIGTIDKSSLCITVQSVLLSEDNAQVVYRSHQLRVDNKGDADAHTTVHIERFTTQNILQLDKPANDIAVKLDTDADSILIVHGEGKGRWIVSSVNISESNGALIDSMRMFPLPVDHNVQRAMVFSFGMVGRNIVAVLMKSKRGTSKADVMLLRIIDFRRKAELSSMCWLERDDKSTQETDPSFNIVPRIKMLNDKRCHAMVTNASNGSIALMTTTNEDTGLLHIVYSKLDVSSAGVDNAPSASDCTSLASALRFAALSGPTEITTWPSLNIVKTRESDFVVQRKAVDDALDKVSKLLTTSAKELIQHEGSSTVGNGAIVNGKGRKGSKSSAHSISWREVYQDCFALVSNANRNGVDKSKTMVNGIKGGATNTSAAEMPKGFFEVAFKETANILLSFRRAGAPINRQSDETICDATSVLLEILRTRLISSRMDYGIRFNSREHIFLSILHACPTISMAENGLGSVGKLHVMNAILENVQDIPEGVLVSILRFLLRNVSVEDVVAYYPSASDASERGLKLLNQYNAKSSDGQEESRNRMGTKLLSEAVLDFTSKIVTYSNCNQSFLTYAMRVSFTTSGEVETLLLTLAKLLRVGRPQLLQEGCDAPMQKCGPFLGVIQWITALTDAHMCTILKISNEGGMVIDRIQHAIRSTMAQSEFAHEVRELLNLFSVVGEGSTNREAKPNASFSMPKETAVLPYTVERLAF